MKALTRLLLLIFVVSFYPPHPVAKGEAIRMRKVKDLIIYRDDMYYCAFPSLVVRKDGEILCAFRRAPNRKLLWGGKYSHTDPNSYLVLVRSKDGGETWTKEPELIYAHPLGGSQDPCMIQLKDGSIVCSSYAWALLPPEGVEKYQKTLSHPPFGFLGGYIMRSDDGGKTWKGPFIPPPVPEDKTLDVLGKPCPAYNRGAMIQRKDGKLYWAVAANEGKRDRLTSVHLMTSSDRGETWEYVCPIAKDSKITLNESSLVETVKGDIVCFIRTANFNDHLVISRSTDGGKSFKWEDGKIIGHPYHAIRLKDGRVFLVYGYRHEPYGVRARLLNPDCTNVAEAPELVIRDDGGNGDLGYPWAALLPDGRILVAYYFNQSDGPRFIAGSIIEIN